jgi:hypothetical protein
MSTIQTRTAAAILGFSLLALPLTGCSSTVTLEPAADSNDPACAAVQVRLPETIDGNAKRQTDAQSTSAWGNPATMIMRCGLPEVLASTLPCVTAGGIDWLVDDSNAPDYRFITFGRKPATEVIVDSKKASGVQALDAIGFSVAQAIKADRLCIDPKS